MAKTRHEPVRWTPDQARDDCERARARASVAGRALELTSLVVTDAPRHHQIGAGPNDSREARRAGASGSEGCQGATRHAVDLPCGLVTRREVTAALRKIEVRVDDDEPRGAQARMMRGE